METDIVFMVLTGRNFLIRIHQITRVKRALHVCDCHRLLLNHRTSVIGMNVKEKKKH